MWIFLSVFISSDAPLCWEQIAWKPVMQNTCGKREGATGPTLLLLAELDII